MIKTIFFLILPIFLFKHPLIYSQQIFYDLPEQNQYTIIVPESQKFCLYHPILPGLERLEFQYEVTFAKFDLDIDCILTDTRNQQYAAIRRKKSRKMTIDTVTMPKGSFEICMSNSYSKNSEKRVFVSTKASFSKAYMRQQKWRKEEQDEIRLKEELMESFDFLGTGLGVNQHLCS